MALKSYKKAPVKIQSRYRQIKQKDKEIIIEESGNFTEKNGLTLWDLLAGIKNDFFNLLKTSTIARILIPAVLIITGSFIIYRQLYPEMKQRARELTGYYDSSRTELVIGESIQAKETYLSNPGADYFKSLTKDALNQNILQEDPTSLNYNGKFNISIPSLGLNSLAVQANVESGVEEAYQQALKNALAHFKGTGLPISDIHNNIVIYGHSAGGDYYSRTHDTAAAFSTLSDIKIGDEIEIQMEGKTYKYRIVKTKIVKPDDTSIITGEKGKGTLTLFTCYPNGNNSKRFVAVARPV